MGHPSRTPIVSFRNRRNVAQCHGYSCPERPRTPSRWGPCVVEIMEESEWRREVTHEEVRWRSARVSVLGDLSDTLSRGQKPKRAKLEYKDLLDGKPV